MPLKQTHIFKNILSLFNAFEFEYYKDIKFKFFFPKHVNKKKYIWTVFQNSRDYKNTFLILFVKKKLNLSLPCGIEPYK